MMWKSVGGPIKGLPALRLPNPFLRLAEASHEASSNLIGQLFRLTEFSRAVCCCVLTAGQRPVKPIRCLFAISQGIRHLYLHPLRAPRVWSFLAHRQLPYLWSSAGRTQNSCEEKTGNYSRKVNMHSVLCSFSLPVFVFQYRS